MEEHKEVPIEKIKVGEHEQRIEIPTQSLDGLSSSIGRLGLLYPLLVRRSDDGYMLLEGHRRLAACRRLGLKTVRCNITDAEPDKAAELAFAGNFFREDLSQVELAAAIADCYKTGKMSIVELAAGFHRSEHWVQSMIAICDWPGEVLEAIHRGGVSVSAANNLAQVTDGNYREFLVRNAVEQGATARTTAAWLQAWRSMQPAEEAVQAEPVQGQPPAQPLAPQGPCFCCAQVFPVNMMSHVPMCGPCVQVIRQASVG